MLKGLCWLSHAHALHSWGCLTLEQNGLWNGTLSYERY